MGVGGVGAAGESDRVGTVQRRVGHGRGHGAVRALVQQRPRVVQVCKCSAEMGWTLLK